MRDVTIEFLEKWVNFEPEGANRAVLPEDLPKERAPLCIIDEKYDGTLIVAKFLPTKTEFLTRRVSSVTGQPIDKIEHLVHLRPNDCAPLLGTMLVGEAIIPGKRFSELSGILNSLPAYARITQAKVGLIQLKIFDCPFYQFKDLRGQPYGTRILAMIDAVRDWNSRYVTTSRAFKSHISPYDVFMEVAGEGGEGIMIKELHAPYGLGVTKCKKVVDTSVIVTGFQDGTGKYEGKIGAIEFGVIGEIGMVSLGKCSGMDDYTRDTISSLREGFIGRVMDVAFQPPDKPRDFRFGFDLLRHPRFLRFREDVASVKCTTDKTLADMLRYAKKEVSSV